MSFQSDILKFAFRISGLKRKFGTAEGMRYFVAHRWPKHETEPPAAVALKSHINKYHVGDRTVYHLKPRNEVPQKHVIYLHGGAYVGVIMRPQWNFLRRLMQAIPCEVTVPLYGLAPEYGYQDAFALVTDVYQELLGRHRAENIIIMGDSSGGGLALAFAQTLFSRGLPQPGGLVLMSPWLDVTCSNPDIAEVAKRDPLLAVAGAREAGLMWASGANPHDPMLSPINGPVKGLAPICTLIGTDDMLLPDARRLRQMAKEENTPLQYLEYESMFHVWMLFALPESKRALVDIVHFMKDAKATCASQA